jgi:hypothetical protein
VTVIKLDSKMATNARDAIDPLAGRLYANRGARVLGVVELAHIERTEPAPDADKEASVKLRIVHLEVAGDEQEEHVREALRALYLQRTARGTLDESGEVRLSERTLELTAGLLHAVDLARLRVAVGHWAEYLRRVRSQDKLTASEIRHELDTIGDGLQAALLGPSQATLPIDPDRPAPQAVDLIATATDYGGGGLPDAPHGVWVAAERKGIEAHRLSEDRAELTDCRRSTRTGTFTSAPDAVTRWGVKWCIKCWKWLGEEDKESE